MAVYAVYKLYRVNHEIARLQKATSPNNAATLHITPDSHVRELGFSTEQRRIRFDIDYNSLSNIGVQIATMVDIDYNKDIMTKRIGLVKNNNNYFLVSESKNGSNIIVKVDDNEVSDILQLIENIEKEKPYCHVEDGTATLLHVHDTKTTYKLGTSCVVGTTESFDKFRDVLNNILS